MCSRSTTAPMTRRVRWCAWMRSRTSCSAMSVSRSRPGPDGITGRSAVEEFLDVQIDHPVGLPAAPAACIDRMQRRPPWPVAVGVRVEDRLDLRLQPPGRYSLGDPVCHGRDGAFILPLLQSGVWMFLFATRVCAVLAEPALADLVM